MPHLDKIVDYLNTSLSNGVLDRKGFQKGQFFGLGKQVEEDKNGTLQTVIYTLPGKDISCIVNDRFPFQIYHRIVSTTYALSDSNGGDGFDDFTETTTLKAVIYGNTRELQLTENDLAFLIITGIATNIPTADIGNLPLSMITATPLSADFNSKAVFVSEYGANADYVIKPQDIFFSLTYQVKMDANKNCLTCVSC